MQHYLFIQLFIIYLFPTDGHLDYFQYLIITNSASINILIHSYLCTYASNLGNKPLEMELLGQMVYVFRILMIILKLPLKCLHQFTLPAIMSKSTCFLLVWYLAFVCSGFLPLEIATYSPRQYDFSVI